MISRFRWAVWLAFHRPWPHGPTAWLRLRWHDVVRHGLLNHGGEICEDCGHRYPLWRADDDLWLRVVGSRTGLCCPGCFSRRSRRQGITVRFTAATEYRHRVSDR